MALYICAQGRQRTIPNFFYLFIFFLLLLLLLLQLPELNSFGRAVRNSNMIHRFTLLALGGSTRVAEILPGTPEKERLWSALNEVSCVSGNNMDVYQICVRSMGHQDLESKQAGWMFSWHCWRCVTKVHTLSHFSLSGLKNVNRFFLIELYWMHRKRKCSVRANWLDLFFWGFVVEGTWQSTCCTGTVFQPNLQPSGEHVPTVCTLFEALAKHKQVQMFSSVTF